MTSYALQKDEHTSKRDDVMKAIQGGKHRFTELCEATGMSKRTLAKVLSELVNDVLIIKEGEGQKIRYSLTDRSHEIFKAEISGFREMSEAYQKWHPSLVSSRSDERLAVGSGAHFPIVQTGSIYSGRTDGEGNPIDPLSANNMPIDPFVAGAHEIEGTIQRDVMNRIITSGANNYIKGAPRKHGKQHVAVVIDYDVLQSTWDMAEEFEDAVKVGDGMTLFFSKRLNSDPEDDPVFAEMMKTGMMSDPSTVSLSNRQRNALLIVAFTLPALLKMVLIPKSDTDRLKLLMAVGRSVDGPFRELVEIYLREHKAFFGNFHQIPGNNFQEKAANYLDAYRGIKKPTSANMAEFMGIMLLVYLGMNDRMKQLIRALDLLVNWGTPFTFLKSRG